MLIFNLLMAATIALIITAMATIKNSRLKALIYGLPLPITVALIATKTPIDTSHIIGLFLLCCFLWSVFYFYEKRGLSIFISDFLSAIGYIILGFLFLKFFLINFWQSAFLYFLFWVIYIWKYIPASEKIEKKSQIRPWAKGLLVFLIATFLLFLKSILKGIVVTFPFSGVLAVVETKDILYILAGEFTKNSLAILVFFIVIKIFSNNLGFFQSIGLGWFFYLPLLLCLQRLKKRL